MFHSKLKNHLEKIPSGVDDIIAKFVACQEPKISFSFKDGPYKNHRNVTIIWEIETFGLKNIITWYYIQYTSVEKWENFVIKMKNDQKCSLSTETYSGIKYKDGYLRFNESSSTEIYIKYSNNIQLRFETLLEQIKLLKKNDSNLFHNDDEQSDEVILHRRHWNNRSIAGYIHFIRNRFNGFLSLKTMDPRKMNRIMTVGMLCSMLGLSFYLIKKFFLI